MDHEQTKEPVHRDDRLVFRVEGNQNVTGIVIILVGFFFIAFAALFWVGGDATSWGLWTVGGLGVALVVAGVFLSGRSAEHDYVDLINRRLEIGSQTYPLDDIGLVVLTDDRAKDRAPGASSYSPRWYIHVVPKPVDVSVLGEHLFPLELPENTAKRRELVHEELSNLCGHQPLRVAYVRSENAARRAAEVLAASAHCPLLETSSATDASAQLHEPTEPARVWAH
ncbi:hypothetical protein FIV42_01225 [Persicimonas caeni]|uniref:Uncharacterized protein n=1 Tax=Persicimonas caeni TaxID=2292766 RepID=A0A4Y6PNL9_PERCE|nr:hypothetical protein [Persicimonas caeni]QDG49405.1 hypothetical protein FIV42_01225 [Persicimonas caeni]QED30626.1 hypothetical protein FRD00_01220 [Persicimonas caeni]